MKTFRKYNPEQLSLMPPAIQDWLPEGHLAYFVSNVVDNFDLSEFYAAYDGTKGGQPPYHPLMMVKLLCFAYCIGIHSSRQIEKATWESVPFRVLAAGEHPDHASLAEFRKRHLTALSNLFSQILEMAMNAQLVDLEHVAIDGTKVKANADRNKNFSVESATKREERLKAHIKEMLEKGIQLDKEEDEKYGDRSSYLLPSELRSKEAQLKFIQEHKEKIEREKKEREDTKAKEKERKEAERKPGSKKAGRRPKEGGDKKPEELKRNLTDYDSRIMRLPGGNWGQSYNAQIAVDGKAQIIVASDVVNEVFDSWQLKPMLNLTKANTGRYPIAATADKGYFTKVAVSEREFRQINLLVPPQQKIEKRKFTKGKYAFPPEDAMHAKLEIPANKALYAKRKTVVEPVFGQIKSAQQKFREFSFRGLQKVKREWNLVCAAHNLLKLYSSKWRPA